MSVPGAQPAALASMPAGMPSSTAEALAMLDGALGYLAQGEAASLTLAEQVAVLRGLERAQSRQTAARTRVLSAFVSGGGLEADGQCSARGWLIWQARVTRGAAAGAVGWMRRLARHPVLAQALAAAQISESWARQLSEWTDLLPEHLRDDADTILLAAAAGGADLADLALLAEEMRRRTAEPDSDDDGFTDRSVRLDVTLDGVGKVGGDLTPGCTGALSAVLQSLGKKAGPEDDRTKDQRYHDALEEACRRLIASGCLPDVAGQPTQIQLHLTLDELRGLDGAADAESVWTAGRAAGHGAPGWITSRAEAEAYACDAQITPIVSGHVNPVTLALMVRDFVAAGQQAASGDRGCGPGGCGLGGCAHPTSGARPPITVAQLQDILLRHAADVLSGPSGLAAHLRGALPGPQAAAVSLPLDVGTAPSTVPPHLRRAVIARDRHCAFPGCDQPPAACQVHHLIPRSQCGPTALTNLALVCAFHHLIAIHRWGWTLALNGDGTTTATSPDGAKILRSHGPPLAA